LPPFACVAPLRETPSLILAFPCAPAPLREIFRFVFPASARPGAIPFRVIRGPDGSWTKELFVHDVGNRSGPGIWFLSESEIMSFAFPVA
jgi:hypothetical protein